MENILATLYLIGVFFTAIVFILFYVSEVIDKWKKRKTIVENEPQPIFEPEIDVVGKSTTAFLTHIIFEKNEPMMSEDLKRKPSAEAEANISPDEVEVIMSRPYVPDDEELEQYANDDTDMSGDFSQGLTYQQISHAIDVVEGKKTGEDDEHIAGETFNLMPSDFLTAICMQPDYENAVKKLIAGYVDLIGKKPKSTLIADFDINKYV